MKKITSFLSAFALCCTSVTALISSAYLSEVGGDEYSYIKNNFARIDSAVCMGFEDSSELYMSAYNDKRVRIISVDEMDDKIIIEFEKPLIPEDFREIRDFIYENYRSLEMFTASSSGAEPLKDVAVMSLCNISSENDVRIIYDKISSMAELSRFDFYDLKKCIDGAADLLLYEEDDLPLIENYLSENNISYSLELGYEYNVFNENGDYVGKKGGYYIIPENSTVYDKLDLANSIQKELNIYTEYGISESIRDISSSIDVLNSLAGDADCDGTVKMNDAVLIMQTIVNPDKYFLTPQGRFNSDTANIGDGITLGDALAVQKMLLDISD